MSGIMMSALGNWKSSAVTPPVLVYDLDAANYAAMPVNGSAVAGTVAYNITVANAGASISWQADNGGLFRLVQWQS